MAKRGPKGQALPPGITWDRGKCRYRIRWKKADGIWGTKSAGRNLEAAKRKLAELKHQARDGVVHDDGQPRSSMTLAEYEDRWAAHKMRTGRRNVKRERNQLRLHIDPVLGRKRPADVTPADIVNLCWDLYDAGLTAGTVTKNLKGTISSVFGRAVFEGVCEINPCALIPRGELPKPGRNPWTPFEPREVERLLTDPRVELDHRMLYRLAFFFIERCGEVCGLKFSDWDRAMTPLGAMTIDTQYQDDPLKGTRDDYIAVRRVPVHPQMQPILAWWRLTGFEQVYRRPPREDDFIVPRLPPFSRQARSHSQVWKALEDDMALVGVQKLPGRATHGFRKAFISMACNDDGAGMAPESVIKALSHTSTSRDAFERYRRWSWETYCKAVECVHVDLSEPGRVLSMEGHHGS